MGCRPCIERQRWNRKRYRPHLLDGQSDPPLYPSHQHANTLCAAHSNQHWWHNPLRVQPGAP
jgi:hypothetical protein